tara:strand:- start:55 stop:1026 length:972 start_codon:yes stop_codon:yes gene_type:complete
MNINKDKKDLISFLKKNFKKKHILYNNNNVFEFYYFQKKKFNFILLKEKKKIKALIGYILNGKFSKNKISTLWISLWVSSKNDNISGLKVLSKLENKFSNYKIACLGLTKEAKKILSALKYNTGELKHYYVLNHKIKKFKIISKPNFDKAKTNKNIKKINYKVVNLNNIEKIKTKMFSNEKNKNYIINKYLINKFYKYKVYNIMVNENSGFILVLRNISIGNSYVGRIIDFSGNINLIRYSGYFFQKFLETNNLEYIDFCVYGIRHNFMSQGNFILKNENTTIPNFFEPLIKKNTKLNFAYKNFKGKFIIVKGDGDQERPNRL